MKETCAEIFLKLTCSSIFHRLLIITEVLLREKRGDTLLLRTCPEIRGIGRLARDLLVGHPVRVYTRAPDNQEMRDNRDPISRRAVSKLKLRLNTTLVTERRASGR